MTFFFACLSVYCIQSWFVSIFQYHDYSSSLLRKILFNASLFPVSCELLLMSLPEGFTRFEQ